MKIAILSHDVVNQIAAGEVVERPSHLIKELVENCLDAGASKIEIEFSNGGRNVRVSDNGSGIAREDLGLALQRHATSKILASEDLFKLSSYGFRGEALASIAAVSNLSLISKEEGQEQAFQIDSNFGKLGKISEVGSNLGTTLVVRDLFANMPARLKFLKSEVAESSQIKQTLKAFALIHPEIEIRVRQEKSVFAYKAQDSMRARVSEVLNTEEVFESEAQLEKLNAKVLFCSPHKVVGNSKGIWLFVQKRWVQDRTIQAAVLEAYRGLLMHGEYPQVVVDLTIDPAEVDVNIHPTKSTVKFRDNAQVFRVVQRALRQGLEQAPWIPNSLSSDSNTSHAAHQAISSAVSAFATKAMTEQVAFSGASELGQTQLRQKLSEPLAAYFARDPAPETKTTIAPENLQNHASPLQKHYWSSLQVLGQAQLTYILSQNSKAMVIVDQHAAHERVMYERLMKSWSDKSFEIQDFLLPLTIQLESSLLEAVLTHKEDLERIGMQVEAMGPEHLAVRSAPAILKESSIQKAIEELAREILDEGGSFAIEKSIMHIFATMACHSAVRAGQALSTEEMKSLLLQMDEFALSSFCPHGRPVSVEYPFHKLERDFGRIN